MSFAEKNKDISILTETHINHDQIHHQIHIRNNWLGPIFFSPGDSHTKGLLVLLHLGLEGVTEVDTDPNGRLVSFRITPSMTELSLLFAPSGHSTREHLARGRFFEGLQNYMENRNKGNENKIILGDFNCTMDKMDQHGENEIQRLYRCCSYYAVKVDNGLRICGEGRT